MGNDVVLHLSRGLVASLDSVDSLACGALQTAVLVAIVVHGDEALEVVLVATLYQAAHRLGSGDASDARTFVARRSGQSLHADGAILREVRVGFNFPLLQAQDSSFDAQLLQTGFLAQDNYKELTSSGGLRTF